MKIGYITRKFDLQSGGGSNISLDLIARRLCQMGNEVTIFVVGSASLPTNNHPYRVVDVSETIQFPTYNMGDFLNLLNNESDNYDLYHIFDPQLIAFGGLYRKLGGSVPVVGRLNTYNFCSNLSMMNSQCYKNCTLFKKLSHSERGPIEKTYFSVYYEYSNDLEPKLMNAVDCLFAISPAVKDIYINNGIKEENIEIIPNFMEGVTNTEVDSDSNISNSLDILYVGRLETHKGVDILLQSFTDYLTNPNTKYELTINVVGEGAERTSLEKQVSNFENYVQFHGWVPHDEISSYYNQADVFVHPGRWPEPFGRTVIEAMQHNCVPIVSDVGGPPWIVGDSGLIFEREDPADLAACINKILSNKEFYHELQSNISGQLRRFEPDRVLSKLTGEYERIMNCS